MSSCQGELTNQSFDVKALDKSGKILFDGSKMTLRNGFFEIWFPRNRKIMLQVKGMNQTALGLIETYANSKTCVTTFRLQ